MAKQWQKRVDDSDVVTAHTVGPKCEELLRLHDLSKESLKYKLMLADKQILMYTQLDEVKALASSRDFYIKSKQRDHLALYGWRNQPYASFSRRSMVCTNA